MPGPGDSFPALSVIFQRALKARSLMIAEAVACEIAATRPLTLNEALGLVALYASEGDDKAERAALRWLRRLLEERTVRAQRGTACGRVARTASRAGRRSRGRVAVIADPS